MKKVFIYNYSTELDIGYNFFVPSGPASKKRKYSCRNYSKIKETSWNFKHKATTNYLKL